jgi:hypothetical protein
MIAAALAATFLVAPTLPAHADTPDTQYVPVPVADMGYPNLVLTQSDNGVTVGCAGWSTGTRRIDASGTVTHSIPNATPWPNACPRNAVVTADGTLVAVAVNNNGWPLVQDIKDGSTAWSYTSFPCNVVVRDMVVGTDGNVYILYTTLCGGQSYLLGLTPGGAAPTVVMNNLGVANNVADGGLAATATGLALRTRTGLQFVSYSGTVDDPMTINNMVGGVDQYHADATLSGRTLVPLVASTAQQQLCGNDSHTFGGVYMFDANGQVWGYNSLPACSHVYEFYMTPSGGAVVHYDTPQGGIAGNSRVQHLLALDADGNQLWAIELTLEQSVVDAGMSLAVDLNGNVAVQRRIRYELNANARSTCSRPCGCSTWTD